MRRNRVPLLLLFLSGFLHLSGYLILSSKIEPFIYFSYLIFWWSFIVGLDSVLFLRKGRFKVINSDLPYTIMVSSAYWSVFEIINVRIQNWFYINLEPQIPIRYAGYFFSYGTVIPAIMLVREVIKDISPVEVKLGPIMIKNYPTYAITAGITTFFLILLYPDYFFPFAWVSPFLIIDGINYKKGYGSIFAEMEKGEYGGFLVTSISGLVCGILWELWNFWGVAKWVYTVPFFEGFKLFEMPLPGYLGFSFFALETVAFVNFIKNLGGIKRKLFLFLASVVLIVSFPLIDRYTVFSFRSKVEDLYFLDKGKIEYLKSKGVTWSHGVDNSLLSREEKERMELMHLYGLGLEKLKKLDNEGVKSLKDLAQLGEKELSDIIGEKNVRRVRIYLKESKKLTKP